MSGTIYLGGGGSADDEALLWSRMLTTTPTILYWPFALDGPMLDGAEAWLRGHLTRHPSNPPVTTWMSLDGHTPDELATFDLLWVGGGNTFRLLDHVRSHDFLAPVRSSVAEGLDFYGGSAGAVIACDSIAIVEGHDRNEVGLTDLSALGLAAGFSVLPHYTTTQERVTRSRSRHFRHPVIGLPERTGLQVSGSRIEVVGYEPAWLIRPGVVNPYGPGTVIDLSRSEPLA